MRVRVGLGLELEYVVVGEVLVGLGVLCLCFLLRRVGDLEFFFRREG